MRPDIMFERSPGVVFVVFRKSLPYCLNKLSGGDNFFISSEPIELLAAIISASRFFSNTQNIFALLITLNCAENYGFCLTSRPMIVAWMMMLVCLMMVVRLTTE